MRMLEPITAFRKNMGRCSEITELSDRSCRQGHTYINIKQKSIC